MHSDPFEDLYHLELHLGSQLLVQRSHRLIEQQQLGPLGQRARQGHALALAAGEMVRLAPGECLHVHQLEHLGHAFVDFPARQLVLLEPEGDVLCHRHVGKQGVGLEHHVDRALIGRNGGDVLTVEHDLPFAGLFEAGQHAQQRRLARAGAAQQREYLAATDRQGDVIHRQYTIEALADAANLHQAFIAGRARLATRLIGTRRTIDGSSRWFRGLSPGLRHHSVSFNRRITAGPAGPAWRGQIPDFTRFHTRVRTRCTASGFSSAT